MSEERYARLNKHDKYCNSISGKLKRNGEDPKILGLDKLSDRAKSMLVFTDKDNKYFPYTFCARNYAHFIDDIPTRIMDAKDITECKDAYLDLEFGNICTELEYLKPEFILDDISIGGRKVMSNILSNVSNNVINAPQRLIEKIAIDAINKAGKQALSKIKEVFGVELWIFEGDSDLTREVSKCLYYADKEKYEKHCVKNRKFVWDIEKDRISYLSLGTDYTITLSDRCTFIHVRVALTEMNNGGDRDTVTLLYIYGKNFKKYHEKFIKKTCPATRDGRRRCLTVYSKQSVLDTNENSTQLPLRPIDTLFMDELDKEKVFKYLKWWMKKSTFFAARAIVFKVGILVTGVAGTGKTSLARAIASEFGADITLMNLKAIRSSYTDFTNRASRNYAYNPDTFNVVLFEDFDYVFKNKEDNDNSEDGENAAYLLQILDGTHSIANTIYIATSNKKEEELDPTLIRAGRFDIKLKMNGIKIDQAEKMCLDFGCDPKDMIDYSKDALIIPSILQDSLIKRIATYENKES